MDDQERVNEEVQKQNLLDAVDFMKDMVARSLAGDKSVAQIDLTITYEDGDTELAQYKGEGWEVSE